MCNKTQLSPQTVTVPFEADFSPTYTSLNLTQTKFNMQVLESKIAKFEMQPVAWTFLFIFS